jgi:hypothetical protein
MFRRMLRVVVPLFVVVGLLISASGAEAVRGGTRPCAGKTVVTVDATVTKVVDTEVSIVPTWKHFSAWIKGVYYASVATPNVGDRLILQGCILSRQFYVR